MRGDKITVRNKENAQKSTGPKTAAGRAIAAQNARAHGATARPDPQAVAHWLRVILNRDLTHDDFEPQNETGRAALRLAEVEARRVMAERATDAASGEEPEPDTELSIMHEIYDQIQDVIDLCGDDPEIMREARTREKRILRWIAKLSKREFYRADTLQRYEREAQRERRRALEDWITLTTPAQNNFRETNPNFNLE